MNSDFLPPRRSFRPGVPSQRLRSSRQFRGRPQQGQEGPAPVIDGSNPRSASTIYGNETPADLPDPVSPAGTPPRKGRFGRLGRWLRTRTKKQWVIIILVLLVILGGVGFAAYKVFHKEPPKPVQQAKKVAPKPEPPKPILSTLTGLPIADAAINERPVTAVMIENSSDARPQSGMLSAGVVFEAIAEGGITRFLTIFQPDEPDYIGPVRSVRPYYVQWATGFDAGVAHVGGSAEALAMIRAQGNKDLDQFFNPGPYRRISGRYAPHNMYSNVTSLRQLQEQKGNKSTYAGFERKEETKPAAATVKSIDFTISSAFYNAHYDYDAVANNYKRSEGGAPHTDERSGQQLAPKVVIGLVMPQGSNGIYTTYNTIGSGLAYVFQDGGLVQGTWHKASDKEQFKFTDAGGAPIKLNPGQTWLIVVGGADRITYR